MIVMVDGKETIMRAGDVIMRQGSWHGRACRTDESCQITIVPISARVLKKLPNSHK